MRVTGVHEVAQLLRTIADEVERQAVDVEGHAIGLSESLEAVIQVADGVKGEVNRIDVRLEQTHAAWDLNRLQQALAHPGD